MNAPRDVNHREQWVGLLRYRNHATGMTLEAGRIYSGSRRPRGFAVVRSLLPDEPVVSCPLCDERFAASESASPEENLDIHLLGDSELPSICVDRVSAANSDNSQLRLLSSLASAGRNDEVAAYFAGLARPVQDHLFSFVRAYAMSSNSPRGSWAGRILPVLRDHIQKRDAAT